MNRVLSWPHTPIFPGLLDALKLERRRTRVSERGTIRFDLPAGAVEMRFSPGEHALPAGTEVYVWWKGGGFVCAPVRELKREQRHEQSIAHRVSEARARLEAARADREARLSAPVELGPPELGAAEYLLTRALQPPQALR